MIFLYLCFACSTSCPFTGCNNIADKDTAGCFTLFCTCQSVAVSVFCLLLTVLWAGL